MSSVSTATPATIPTATVEPADVVRIFGHSSILYWWPVWSVGFANAAITYFAGTPIEVGSRTAMYYPGQVPGLIFVAVLLLVILFTNVVLRGWAAVLGIMGVVIVGLVLAILGLWDAVLAVVPQLSVQMNLGFYSLVSTLLFLGWVWAVFVYDRTGYWSVRAGQVVHHTLVGEGARAYDTMGMVFEKRREDPFRHWLLGLGSGDLRIRTSGAAAETIDIPNVLFIDSKLERIQRLIASRSRVEG
jgi:hypothetical protein